MSDPLKDLDATEAQWLRTIAETEGLSLGEVRKRRDQVAEQMATAFREKLERMAAQRDMAVDDLMEQCREDERAGNAVVAWLQSHGFEINSRWELASMAETTQKQRAGGSEGGKRSKRKPWAEWAARQVRGFDDLPEHSAPLEYGMLDVYRDGDRIVCGGDGVREEALKRSTFERHYLRGQ